MDDTRTLILAKIESPYGTDATPGPTTDVITCEGEPTIEPIIADKERNVSLPFMGKLAPVRIGEGIKVSFRAEFKAGGAPGTPPQIGCLLRACQMAQTINTGVSVVYALHSTQAGESVTIAFYRNKIKHVVKGCTGTFKIDWKTNDRLYIDFELTGLHADPHQSDVTWPETITHVDVDPLIFRAANLKFNALTTLIADSFSLDMGNVISKRTDVNNANGISRYYVSGRQITGSFNPEVEALSTFDPWDLNFDTTPVEMEIKPTGTAGKKFELVLAGVVLDVPKYAERDKISVYDLGFKCHPTLAAGNTELTLTFK